MMDHLDLLVIGGYRGQGRRRDLISMFLLGVALPSPEPGQPPREFLSFARVGSGYSDEQLLGLMQKLQGSWKNFDKKSPPPMIHCGREKPDFWIEPSQSVVLEVYAFLFNSHLRSDSNKIFAITSLGKSFGDCGG